MQNLKNQKTFTIKNSKTKDFHASVYLVYRGNFNDERLVESKTFVLADMVDKPLVWFDGYLGKKPGNKVKLAFACLENDVLYLLKDDGNEISVQKKDGFTFYLTDDYDEKYIISTQIW